MNAFFDIHHHFLYGLDDGAQYKLEMQQMLTAAHEDGVRTLIATPHITPGLTPIPMELLNLQIEEARIFSHESGLNLEICLGSEILYTYHVKRFLSERLLPTMAGSNKVLIEFATSVKFPEIEDAVLSVLRAGYLPVLAHIERYACLMQARQRLGQLKKKYDVFFQVNADSILNRQDFTTARSIRRAIQDGMIDFIASDAHHTQRRACNLQRPYNKLVERYGKETADRMTGNHQTPEWFQRL